MSRPLRIEYPFALYHVTSRGNEKKAIFNSDADRELFLETLTAVNKRFNWLCHACCLMNNHYHLVIETIDGMLSKGMRHLNGVYTQSFNKRYRRTGHLFQGRYKAILIQKDSHLLEVCRYVVLNPVRARAVKEPEQWKWSSYRATAGMEKAHSCLTTDWILGRFDNRKKRAQTQYREFVGAGIGKETIWTAVKGQSLLGGDGFIQEHLGYVKGYEEVKEIPRSQRHLARPALEDLMGTAALVNRKKRNTAIRRAVHEYGYSQREIADHLHLHYSTISRLAGKD